MKPISNPYFFLFSFVVLLIAFPGFAQSKMSDDRFEQIKQSMQDLADINPGLNETVEFAVSGATIQEFLRGLAEANNLNISVDPALDFRVYNNFTNEKVINILLFLVKQYNLDVQFIGGIMAFHPYLQPTAPAPVIIQKELNIKFNAYNETISMDLTRDTLSKVVKKLTQETKKNVILSAGITDRQISVFIQDAPFESGLQKMALANNLKVVKTEDNFFVIKSPEEGEDLIGETNNKPKSNFNNPFPSQGNAQRRPQTNQSNQANQGSSTSGGNVFVDVKADTTGKALITIEATNAPVSDIIKTVAAETGVSYFMYSEVKGNTTVRIMNVGFDDFLKRILQGTDYTYKKNLNLYLIGERKLEGLRAHKVIQMQYRSAKDISQMIPAEIKHGVEIKEFIELNSLLLTGSHPQIEEIEAFIHGLDKVVPMVLIDVIIMDVRKGRTTETGISAGLSDSVKSGGSIYPGINFKFSAKSVNQFLSWLGTNNALNLGRVKPEFYVQLKALESNNNVEVRSTPKLSTLNGHKATLSIGSTRYYTNETQNVVGSLQPQTLITKQFNQVQANLAISINPVVAGDDQITLEIDVNNSDFLETTENKPPASATSQFNSMIRVKNEEMIVLGGLERYEKSESGSGLPVLSRIPVLKYLFSNRKRTKSKTVTIVFIKPSIIY